MYFISEIMLLVIVSTWEFASQGAVRRFFIVLYVFVNL